MAIEKIIALDNIDEVVENAEVVTTLDPVTSDAYINSVENAEKVSEIIDELETKAEEVATENPVAPEIKEKNIYTRLTLDESIQDFSYKDLSDDSDEDEYLDYDMFDFVYGLVTDDWPRPKNPLGRKMRKFQHTDSDDYLKTNEPTGKSQVSTDSEGNVVVYANDAAAFDDVREASDYYHLSYSDVQARKNERSHWAFNMTIYVPMTAEGYPEMVEDFFAKYDLKLSDVIEDHKVGGGKSANWGKTYDKKVEKDIQEKEKFINDSEVDSIFDKYVEDAAKNGDIPLEDFIKKMFSELDNKELDYSKIKLKKQFIAEFEDDFED